MNKEINDYINYIYIEKKLSNNTKESYERDLYDFSLYFKNKGIDCVTDNDIKKYISYLSDKKELLDAFNIIDVMEISENYTYEEIMDYINILNKYNIEDQIKKLTNEFKRETDEIKKIEIFKEISNLKVRV